MIKRTAESLLPDDNSAKKQKTGDATPQAEPALAPSGGVSENASHACIQEQGTGNTSPEGFMSGSQTDTEAIEHETSSDQDVSSTPKKAGENSTFQARKTKKPPVGDGFADFKRDVAVPPSNPFWGTKPLPGGPRPDPIQPSARESNGQTNPPLWEDRGYRYKRGSRFVKYFGPIAPDNVDELEADLDQEDLLVVKMIDMRPKSKRDPTPKRTPMVYCYGKTPKDWNNMQTIKALNDRRYQAIDRTTMDPPWTRIEREYLASLLRETPDASIWDLTERHNDRFMGKDFRSATGFGFANLSTGRTVESVRHEYTTYKPIYDAGRAPDMVRWRGDPSAEAKAIRATGRAERAFGPPSKLLEMAHDAEYGGSDGEDDTAPLQKQSKASCSSRRDDASSVPFSNQQALDDDDEMLLELAGAYDADSQPASPRDDVDDFVNEQLVSQAGPSFLPAADKQDDNTKSSVKDTAPVRDVGLGHETHDTNALSSAAGPSDWSSSGSVPETPASERRASLHAMRKIVIDEDYDDDDDEDEVS